MSLINKMLQELDARRSDSSGASPFGQQVRAVPERRQLHPAWWAAIALAVVLASVLSWLWLRPAEHANTSPSRLPLKLDLDLNIEQPLVAPPPQLPADVAATGVSPTAEKSAVTETTTTPIATTSALEAPAPPPVPAMATESLEQKSREIDRPEPASEARKDSRNSKNSKQLIDVTARKSVPVTLTPEPELSKIVPPVKLIALPPPREADVSASLPVNKKIKELSAPQRAENEYRKAVLAMKQGKAEDTISGLELALQLDAYHAAARQTLVGVLLEQSRQDDAVRWAREGVQLDASQVGLTMIFARLLVEKGDLKPAIETLERSLTYAADRADFQAFLAALLQRDEKHKQAAEHYLLALQRSPQNGVWWMGLGISFQAEHRNPEAAEAFRRAKATNSLSPELSSFVDGRLVQLQR